ncbi:MAG TPA: hypothetical protein VE783_05990 [Candidatus Limnocylindrales bacterium]|nr:hypothetical protein [Candidatus Limnocylindrales bacterium]
MANENRKTEVSTIRMEQKTEIFLALKDLLQKYEGEFAIKANTPSHYYLETRSLSLNGRRLFFAAAKLKKNYVSFYLTPLNMYPELSVRVSPGLRKTMQGQSCFNLTMPSRDDLNELRNLTEAGYQRFRKEPLL